MSNPDGYDPTSERVSVDEYQAHEGDYLIYLFHLASYDFALPYADGRRVLDFGCGTGYGADRIAKSCTSITGVDVAADAISFARSRYVRDNLNFEQIAPVDDKPLPFADGSFDVVLSFQVIEHVPDPDRYLAEARRVLTDDGVMIVATPERGTRLLPGQRPWNRYHLVEYAPDELSTMMRAHFARVELNAMSADRAIIGRELNRSRNLKWATLPFTFPGAPERLRQAGLGGLKTIKSRLRGGGASTDGDGHAHGAPEGTAGGAGEVPLAAARYPYDETAIKIAPGLAPSVNIVAVAKAS
jgi:SAM-dependent methyltransferase